MLTQPWETARRVLISQATRMLLAACLGIACANTYASTADYEAARGGEAQAQQDAVALEVGAQVKREIAGGEWHSYLVRLESGQRLRAVVEDADVELKLTITKPGGETESHTFGRAAPPETRQFPISPELTGVYRIEVRASDNSPRGSYKLKVELIAGASLVNLPQPEERRDAERQARKQKKQSREKLGRIDRMIREESVRLPGEQITQAEGGRTPSLNEEYTTTADEYNATRDPVDADTKAYIALTGVTRTQFESVRKTIPKGTTLLSYFINSDHPAVFIINSETVIKRELGAGAKDVVSTVDDFRSFASTSDVPFETLEQWYSWLVSPVEVDLEASNLGIVGDGAVQYLPFAALTKNGRSFFSERFNLFYLQRMEMFSIRDDRRGKGVGRMLVVAPRGILGLPFLENSDEEVTSIKKLYKIKQLTGRNATKTQFLTVADKYQIVHVIAHAQCDERVPKLSRIVLEPDANNDESLWVADVSELKLKNIDLIVLSACETKVCGEYRADEINTLTDAFITAGVPTVIASLWKVEDGPTSLFMSSFYKHLKRMSKAAALAAAQNEIRAKYPHPYFWAAFVLTGDPGATVIKKPSGH